MTKYPWYSDPPRHSRKNRGHRVLRRFVSFVVGYRVPRRLLKTVSDWGSLSQTPTVQLCDTWWCSGRTGTNREKFYEQKVWSTAYRRFWRIRPWILRLNRPRPPLSSVFILRGKVNFCLSGPVRKCPLVPKSEYRLSTVTMMVSISDSMKTP